MRIVQEVTDADTRPVLDGIDPAAPGYGAHLPFYLILQRCGLAWREFLLSLQGFEDGIIVPHVSADFAAEVVLGPLQIDVGVTRIGTTSFTLRCTVSQEDAVAAHVDVVLVCFDYEGGSPVTLSGAQRAELEAALLPRVDGGR